MGKDFKHRITVVVQSLIPKSKMHFESLPLFILHFITAFVYFFLNLLHHGSAIELFVEMVKKQKENLLSISLIEK